jgi:hypothetical protein
MMQQFTDNNIYFQRGSVFGSTAIVTGAWTQYVMTYDGTTLKGYKNATEVYSAGDTNSISGVGLDYLQWGRRNIAGSLYYDGKMDLIGVWTRAITGTEVTELYNAGAGLAYPFPTTNLANVKTVNGIVKANVKTFVSGIAIANVKTFNTVN